ncbi:MAG: AAA family ATPase [Omnitrophica WOR_2 bacterium]
MSAHDTRINVITISRELGSLGLEIARAVSEQLGFRLVWREYINQAASRAGAPETALEAMDELGLLGVSTSLKSRRAYQKAVHQVIEELAKEGNVIIVGRAGQAILRGYRNVLHVRITAPLQTRIGRVAHFYQINPDCAQAQVEASDRFRRDYLRRNYKSRWDNPHLYDIVLNTEHLSVAEATQIICLACTIPLKPQADSVPS